MDIEASSAQSAAMALASNGVAPGSRKKQGWNLDISAIHRRIKDDMRGGGAGARSRPAAPASDSASEKTPLPPGWEVMSLLHFCFSSVTPLSFTGVSGATTPGAGMAALWWISVAFVHVGCCVALETGLV